VASGGETTISGSDANGAVLAYTAGLEQVVLNGAVLVRGQDYTATNGTSITGLSPALVASDVLEVFSFIAFSVANTYTQSQVDGLVSAVPGMKLIVPTSVTGGTLNSSGSVTFSGATAVYLDGIFSSTYQNYRIVFSGTCTASTGLVWRFRTGGVENSNSNYSNAFYRYQSDNTVAGEDGRESSSLWQWLNAAANQPFAVSVDVYSPQESTYTFCSMNGFISTSSSRLKGLFGAGQFGANTSFDGGNLFVTSGSITGTIRVYGYKN
jgi:hypothetical protein